MSSIAAIGHTNIPGTHTPDPANHQYDSDDFFAALNAGNLPSVTFLKAPAFQDGHAGYSNPIDEQAFIVKTVNAVQESKFWASTAIVIPAMPNLHSHAFQRGMAGLAEVRGASSDSFWKVLLRN